MVTYSQITVIKVFFNFELWKVIMLIRSRKPELFVPREHRILHILLSGNASKVTYFELGQIFKEKQNKIIYFPIYNNNSYKKYVIIYGTCIN